MKRWLLIRRRMSLALLAAAMPVALIPCSVTAGDGRPTVLDSLRWGRFQLDSPIGPDSLRWEELDLDGRSLSNASLEEVVQTLLRRLADAGYPFATVRVGGFNRSENRVSGTITIVPGRSAALSGLVLDGAKVTRPRTGERLAGVRPGDSYTRDLGERARERLLRSGLFTSVGEVRAHPGDDGSSVVLKTTVTEPPYTRFTGILGVSGPDAVLTGLVDLVLANVAGTAREAAGRWEDRGDGLTRFRLHYREPWLPWLPVGLTGDLDHDINEGLYSFTKWEVGGDLAYHGALHLHLGLGGAKAVITDSTSQNSTERFVSAGIQWDRRNSAFSPSEGYRLGLVSRRGTKKQRTDSGDRARFDRTRWELLGEWYRPLDRRWVAAIEGTFVYLDTREPVVPRFDLFALGGATTLRGFREEQFLTTAAGWLRNELRLRQDSRGSALYGFWDAALFSSRVDPDARDDFDRFVFGYGVGVRQWSKIGLLSVEYGVARGESPLDGRIHLRLDALF